MNKNTHKMFPHTHRKQHACCQTSELIWNTVQMVSFSFKWQSNTTSQNRGPTMYDMNIPFNLNLLVKSGSTNPITKIGNVQIT